MRDGERNTKKVGYMRIKMLPTYLYNLSWKRLQITNVLLINNTVTTIELPRR